MQPFVKIYDNPQLLAHSLSLEIAHRSAFSKKHRQSLNLALSGGTTPTLLFETMAQSLYNTQIHWKNIRFFWGDERCVPPQDPQSNFGVVQQSLFSVISIPKSRIMRIHGETKPEKAAENYSKKLTKFLPLNSENIPVFDWILLGIGTDGHTASLFPNSETLSDTNFCSVATHPTSGQKRVTLTLPVINAARRISFLVTGAEKQKLVSRILKKEKSVSNLPAAMVHPKNGILEWWLDADAAKDI